MYAPDTHAAGLYQYDLATSPHLAARASNRVSRPRHRQERRQVQILTYAVSQLVPSDRVLLEDVHDFAFDVAVSGVSWLFVETAGGVHSPAPSGTTQADVYMSLRLPVILVADYKLGGMSATIAAFESLRMRGYDIEMVVVFQDEVYKNYEYLTEYFMSRYRIPVWTAPIPPPVETGHEGMVRYYEENSKDTKAVGLLNILDRCHTARVDRLRTMAAIAHEKVWFPFTQHKWLRPEDITVIESAHGDFFQTATPSKPTRASIRRLLAPSFDGSASWWTQGLGHGNPKLSLAAAYAASRYGHVTFAKAVHEPGLALVEELLDAVGNPRLTRAFFSDNGSTGMEVAVKMALRATCQRYGWGVSEDVQVLGLKGGYHGDTIGVMNAAEPTIFNQNVDWYTPKGYWFDYPKVRCINGMWVVDIPCWPGVFDVKEVSVAYSLHDVFDLESRDPFVRQRYEEHVQNILNQLIAEKHKFGALIIEPLVLGAGGMVLV